MSPDLEYLYRRVAHGDEAHRAWLLAEFEQFEIEQNAKERVVEVVSTRVSIEPVAPDLVADVAAFAEKFGLTYDGRPRVLPLELAEFRRAFLAEEIKEYSDHSYITQQLIASPSRGLVEDERITEHLAEMLDALQDEIYVAIGTALLHGFNPAILRESWNRIHAANMSKVRTKKASDSKRGTSWDVTKPPGFIAPDHRDLVKCHAHVGLSDDQSRSEREK